MEINVEEQEIENNQHMPSALLKSFFFLYKQKLKKLKVVIWFIIQAPINMMLLKKVLFAWLSGFHIDQTM